MPDFDRFPPLSGESGKPIGGRSQPSGRGRPGRSVWRALLVLGAFAAAFCLSMLLLNGPLSGILARRDLKAAIEAVEKGDIRTAADLQGQDIAAYPTGRKRESFDTPLKNALLIQFEKFITQANMPEPITGAAADLAELGLYFQDEIYTRTYTAIDEVGQHFKNNMVTDADLEIKFDNYRKLGAFVDDIVNKQKTALQPVMDSRERIARADQLVKNDDLINAAEIYNAISERDDPAGYRYAQQQWGAEQNRFISQALGQISAAMAHYKYNDALELADRALKIFPNNTELKAIKQEVAQNMAVHQNTLVDYKGPVPHFFTHNLVSNTSGFMTDYGWDLDNDCMTPRELRNVLQQLYDNNYILIDIRMLFTEGNPAKAVTTLQLPKGKKPFILSFDDVNYYTKNRGKGMVDRLVIDENNMVCGEVTKADGTVELCYDEHIPIVEAFIEQHPDFAFDGARPMICLTGYDRVMGYYCRLSTPPGGFLSGFESMESRQTERAEAKKVAARLADMGWMFASHSFGHANYGNQGLPDAIQAANQWRDEVQTLLPEPTTVFVLAYGARPASWTDQKMTMLRTDYGFSLLCGVGNKNDILWEKGNYVFMDRRSMDGYTLRNERDAYLKFFDTEKVYDKETRLPDFSQKGSVPRESWSGLIAAKRGNGAN